MLKNYIPHASVIAYERLKECINLLSHRELEVANMLVEEVSSKEVAERLGVTPAVIKIHKRRIFQKMNVKTIQGLTIKLFIIKNELMHLC